MESIDNFCQFGILDTCNLIVKYPDVSLLNLEALTNIQSTIDSTTGEIVKSRGKLKNLIIEWNNSSLKVYGSIASYWYGNNFYCLTRTEAVQAYAQLSKELGIDLFTAEVIRLDFAVNINVPVPVKDYFQLFSDKSYHKRNQCTLNSLYYSNSVRKFVIYDKIKQLKAGNIALGKESSGNIMRLELRYMSSFLRNLMSSKLGIDSLLLGKLLEPNVFIFFIRKWREEYFAIKKEGVFYFDLSDITTPKQLEEQLIREGIISLGGIGNVLKAIDISHSIRPFPRPESKSRIKKRVRDIMTQEKFVTKNLLIEFLDQTVEGFTEKCIDTNAA